MDPTTATTSSARTTRVPATQRPTSWWLGALRQRSERMRDETLKLSEPITWSSDDERRAAIKFFNAAFRAEESGLTQAHELADEVRSWDPDLAEVLRLYGSEEGWHRELISEFLGYLGGGVMPMGPVTRALYRLYARADRMETIVLTNLMFETIGATTYRLALGRVRQPSVRQMLTILTRDESFHVPLNVHFLREVLRRRSPAAVRRLQVLHKLLFVALVALPLASRPKSRSFDQIGTAELARAYAEHLARLFAREADLPFAPPRWLLAVLGVDVERLGHDDAFSVVSSEAALRAANRDEVVVTAL